MILARCLVEGRMVNIGIKDKIVIFITHRMAHCKESQLTFVMKEGRLIQQGSYEELFNQANLFRELVENQKNLERIIENER